MQTEIVEQNGQFSSLKCIMDGLQGGQWGLRGYLCASGSLSTALVNTLHRTAASAYELNRAPLCPHRVYS